MADLHLIFTDYEKFGYSVTSPQIPGLVAAYDSMAEAMAEVPQFEALHDGHEKVWLHEQKVASAPNGDEYLVRFLGIPEGEFEERRSQAVGRSLASIANGSITEFADGYPRLKTSERLLVAVVSSDKLGWCLDQMEAGEGMSLEMNPHSDVVYSVALLDKDKHPDSPGLEELGLDRDSTVEDLCDQAMAAEASKLRIAVHA